MPKKLQATTPEPSTGEVLLRIADTESYSHLTLMEFFKIRTQRAIKDLIDDLNCPYFLLNGVWIVDGADLRKQMKANAMTHTERKSLRAEA